MPSIGHIAVGAAAGCLYGRGFHPEHLAGAMALFSAASLLPDADGIAFRLGIPYGASFGHRGASHSLAAAVLIGILTGLAGRVFRMPAGRTTLFATAVAASHGLLDTMTDGGLGVALFWPFSNSRFFAPWRPIPVAPIGLGMLSQRGLGVLAFELVFFSPLFLFAFWPRGRK